MQMNWAQATTSRRFTLLYSKQSSLDCKDKGLRVLTLLLLIFLPISKLALPPSGRFSSCSLMVIPGHGNA